MRDSKYSVAVSLVVLLPMISMGQRRPEGLVPLKNWATPLYWQPSQAERAGRLRQTAAPQLQFSTNAVSTNALTFVAITPCRLVDTRGAADGFNGIAPFSGPSIPAAGNDNDPGAILHGSHGQHFARAVRRDSVHRPSILVQRNGGARGRRAGRLFVALAGGRCAAYRRNLKRSSRIDRGQRRDCSGGSVQRGGQRV